MQKAACVAFTVAFGPVYPQMAESTRNSFHAFHPEIPFLIFTEEEYRDLISETPAPWKGEVISLRILIGWFLSLSYQNVIYLDADMIVLGPLDAMKPEKLQTVLTSDACDIAGATIPGMSRVTSSFAYSSGTAFWKIWAWMNYSYLFPTIDYACIDQISLRLLEMDPENRCKIYPEKESKTYYNTCVFECEGEWRVKDEKVFKGDVRAMIYHSAASPHRGIGSLPLEIRPFAEKLIQRGLEKPTYLDFKALCELKRDAFHDQVFDLFKAMPTLPLEEPFNFINPKNPFEWACVAPQFFDQHRAPSTIFKRRLDPKMGVFLYTLT